MTTTDITTPVFKKKTVFRTFLAFLVIGWGAFIFGISGQHPERAWQAFLINFLLWSAIAQGGFLFSTVMRITKARWTGPLAGISESFAAFFPISFVLFLILFLGKVHVFPWIHEDLHGKEIWLNIPFLFSRDCAGLLILYGLGFAYLYYALQLKEYPQESRGKLQSFFYHRSTRAKANPERLKSRLTVLSGLYILAYALVLCLIGYDLVMSMDPHWISTLFGAYTFVKAFYIGLGGMIILSSIFYLHQGDHSGLTLDHFHDLGKLFFAFCLLWGDFFYVQLVVIWYGNVPEESAYVIERTMTAPWNTLAWGVFIMCFILPFVILLNKAIKTKPKFMIVFCSLIIAGIWLEHFLLLGPVFSHEATSIPLGLMDGLITLGFLGLMFFAMSFFYGIFPERVMLKERTVN